MNNRQKRLCRALLDFYDTSGAQPCPLTHLAKKTGYHASDIYDKDSQSGDLWPFDPKARGNMAGMITFTSGKNPTASLTSAGLVGLEKLCADEPGAVPSVEVKKPVEIPKIEERKTELPRMVPPPAKSVSTPPRRISAPAHRAPPDENAEARSKFMAWLKSDEGRETLLDRFQGEELVLAAIDKFFREFFSRKDT